VKNHQIHSLGFGTAMAWIHDLDATLAEFLCAHVLTWQPACSQAVTPIEVAVYFGPRA